MIDEHCIFIKLNTHSTSFKFTENQVAEQTIPESIADLTSLRGVFFGEYNSNIK